MSTLTPLRKKRRAPKRCLTSYTMFVKANFSATRKEIGCRVPRIVMRALAEKWRTLSVDEREKYVKQEQEDRQRYLDAKVVWASGFSGRVPPLRRRRKDKNAPRRTRNAYIFFETEMAPQIKRERPQCSQQDVIKECSRRWHLLPKEEKERFAEKSLEDKIRYATEIKQYRFRKAGIIADQRVRNLEIRLSKLGQRNSIIRKTDAYDERIVYPQKAPGLVYKF
uniref:HMG box domain-containing protein n=1 Tax=Romanomermis culicivorax TaxID=13658 RepID=A0A915HM18_ROMCU